ncbi:MAG: hypothetical protein C5B47_04040 [Verrucomicrobia bacterium]|nr:MAG: hypothetical protein C5B47_04040 [Verrucomicrobiota bacterium]
MREDSPSFTVCSSATIALIAPGLIGGSLALALKKRTDWEVRIWARDPAALQQSEEILHPARASLELEEVIPGTKIIVLCTPVSAMGRLARRIYPLVDKDAVVTDVGSVKASVMGELVPIFQDRFVGGHPMAGSERNGLEAAKENLFENAVCILTPLETPHSSLQLVRNLWAAVGARTVEMTPEAHDAAVALISHLPHAAAAALVKAVCSQNCALQKLSGKGYQDTTRIAKGSPELWVDIFLENREPILKALAEYTSQLQALSHFLRLADSNALRSFFEEAKEFRSFI